MPRTGDEYSLPAGTAAVSGGLANSSHVNSRFNDLAAEQNLVRPIAHGGTGASSASAARAALGLEIGVNVQAYDADLGAIAALGYTSGAYLLKKTAANTYSLIALTAAGEALLDDANAAAQLTTLGIGGDIPALEALSGTGLVARTASDAYALRQIVSADGSVTITNPAGVAGDIDLSAPGGRTRLATKTASGSGVLSFTEFDNATYSRYEFELTRIKPATDGAILNLRFSTDGGSSYDSGAGDYTWGIDGTTSASTTSAASGGDTSIRITHNTLGVGNAANEYGVSGRVEIIGAPDSVYTEALWQVNYWRDSGAQSRIIGGGARLAAQDTDAVRFFFDPDNIASGTIRMYGIK